MAAKKRGRPAKKHAQADVSETPAAPSSTMTPAPSISGVETAGTSGVAKKRGRPSLNAESSSIASTPRKRGRPRKKQLPAPACNSLVDGLVYTDSQISSVAGAGESIEQEAVLTRSSKVIADSQENVDSMNDNQDSDDFKQGLKNAMKEIFIRNAIQQDGGL